MREKLLEKALTFGRDKLIQTLAGVNSDKAWQVRQEYEKKIKKSGLDFMRYLVHDLSKVFPTPELIAVRKMKQRKLLSKIDQYLSSSKMTHLYGTLS